MSRRAIIHASQIQRLKQGLDLYTVCNDDYEEFGTELGAGGTCTEHLLYKVTAGSVDGNALGSYFISDGTETTDASNRCAPVKAGDLSGNDKHLDVYRMTWANGPDSESNGSLDNDNGLLAHPDGSSALGTGSRTVMIQLYVDAWVNGRTAYPTALYDGEASWYYVEPDTGGADEGSANDQLTISSSDGPPFLSVTESNWARGNWNWIWMNRQSGGEHVLGRNYSQIGSGTIDSLSAGTEDLKFGGKAVNTAPHTAIDGKIARIIMYDRLLANWEIVALQQGLLERALKAEV